MVTNLWLAGFSCVSCLFGLLGESFGATALCLGSCWQRSGPCSRQCSRLRTHSSSHSSPHRAALPCPPACPATPAATHARVRTQARWLRCSGPTRASCATRRRTATCPVAAGAAAAASTASTWASASSGCSYLPSWWAPGLGYESSAIEMHAVLAALANAVQRMSLDALLACACVRVCACTSSMPSSRSVAAATPAAAATSPDAGPALLSLHLHAPRSLHATWCASLCVSASAWCTCLSSSCFE